MEDMDHVEYTGEIAVDLGGVELPGDLASGLEYLGTAHTLRWQLTQRNHGVRDCRNHVKSQLNTLEKPLLNHVKSLKETIVKSC